MIVLPHEQGSEEWRRARLGIPTASQFHRIISPTGQPSKQADQYMYELLAERALGEPIDQGGSLYMERGSEMEAQAVAWYEYERDVETTRVGLCLHDLKIAGCSPDRLIAPDGGLEVKIPSAAVQMGYLVGHLSDKHKPQVQGCMWITDREWWDVLAWNPVLPSALVRARRDSKYIGVLSEAVLAFARKLDEMWADFQAKHRVTV